MPSGVDENRRLQTTTTCETTELRESEVHVAHNTIYIRRRSLPSSRESRCRARPPLDEFVQVLNRAKLSSAAAEGASNSETKRDLHGRTSWMRAEANDRPAVPQRSSGVWATSLAHSAGEALVHTWGRLAISLSFEICGRMLRGFFRAAWRSPQVRDVLRALLSQKRRRPPS